MTAARRTVRIEVVQDPDAKEQIATQVLRALPQWFGIESSTLDYISKSRSQLLLAACDGDAVVGFLTLVRTSDHAYEVHVMGVVPDHHREGIGSDLIRASVELLRGYRIRFLTVKTLSAVHPDEGYARTREFYRSVGFLELETLPELWGPDNPCLNMIMVL